MDIDGNDNSDKNNNNSIIAKQNISQLNGILCHNKPQFEDNKQIFIA